MTLFIEAYAKLGVEQEDVKRLPQITPMLRMIGKTIRVNGGRAANWIKFLEMSGDPEAYKVVEAYHSIKKMDSKDLPIEAFCSATGVSPYKIMEVITSQVVRAGAQASTIIAAVMHPKVVEKTVEMALTDEGFGDRQTLHKATGFLPSPKGSQTNINVTQNANPQVAVVAAPPPEQTIRRLADRFNALKDSAPVVMTEQPINEEEEADEE